MFKNIMRTGNSAAGLFLRLALGIVMLAHGLQQTFGLFGGIGIKAKIGYYTGTFHIPWIIALLGVLTVSVGAFLLIIGLWSRIMAFFISIFLLTAFSLVHVHNGFFMNWEGRKAGEGFEYHILGIGIAIAIMIYGSGWFSIDRLLTRKDPKKEDALQKSAAPPVS